MKLIKLVIPFLFLQSLLLSCKSNTYTYNDDIPAGIIEAIKAGNARELAKYFQNSVELALTDIDDVYSKNQAELIIRCQGGLYVSILPKVSVYCIREVKRHQDMPLVTFQRQMENSGSLS